MSGKEQLPDHVARVLIEECGTVDAKWRDGESSAAVVYFSIVRRFHRHRAELRDEEAWTRKVARRESHSFHSRLYKRTKGQPHGPTLDEHCIQIDYVRGPDTSRFQRVHPREHVRFGLQDESYSDVERRALASFSDMQGAHQELIGAALHLPGYLRLTEIARRENVARQNVHQKAQRLLAKWKESLRCPV